MRKKNFRNKMDSKLANRKAFATEKAWKYKNVGRWVSYN